MNKFIIGSANIVFNFKTLEIKKSISAIFYIFANIKMIKNEYR